MQGDDLHPTAPQAVREPARPPRVVVARERKGHDPERGLVLPLDGVGRPARDGRYGEAAGEGGPRRGRDEAVGAGVERDVVARRVEGEQVRVGSGAPAGGRPR